MGRQAAIILYVLVLISVIVGMDVLFFANRTWERLVANIGMVLLFALIYLGFFGSPWP